MTSPYREGGSRIAAEAPRDPGLVDDVVRQFADPFGFHRELVQNAIDAGASAVHVVVRWQPDAAGTGPGEIEVSVRDDGSGMDRDTIENQLLVLFRSSKEGRDDAIGRFGIGFVSVLAVDPRLVVVTTSRGDGRAHRLHLAPDGTYELFEMAGGSSRGTTVTLHVTATRKHAVSFGRSSRRALERWCRHVRVPLYLDVAIASPASSKSTRIDRPFALDDVLVEVERRSADGSSVVRAGLARTGPPRTSLFRRGMTLLDVATPLAGPNVVLAIEDARLEHTLSRDDVRRDATFERAMSEARATIAGPLRAAAIDALAREARVKGADYGPLLHAIAAVGPAWTISREEWVYPLIEPCDGADVVTAEQLGRRALGARERTTLTRAVAAAGTPVVDLAACGLAPGEILPGIGASLPDVHDRFAWIEGAGATEIDHALLAELGRALDAAGRAPPALVLARLAGATADRLAVTVDRADGPWLVETVDTMSTKASFRALARRPLAISVAHPIVEAARQCARRDPVLAGCLLARVVLLEAERLDDGADEALTIHGIDRILGGDR